MLKNLNSTDLDDAGLPSDVPGILRRAAQKMLEDGSELDSAHQDKNAGRPWRKIAKELERAADRIEAGAV